MCIRGVLWSVLALSAFSGPMAAAQADVEVTPFGGYRFGGSFELDDSTGAYDLDDSPAAGLIVNWRHRDNTRWEIIYARQSTTADFDGVTVNDPRIDTTTHVLQLGGTYQGVGDAVRPYLAATLGGTHVRVRSRGSESDTFLSGSIGVGLLFRPEARIGARLEARAYGTLVDSGTDLLCQTGPNQNFCALRIEGDVFWQVDTFAGFVVRF